MLPPAIRGPSGRHADGEQGGIRRALFALETLCDVPIADEQDAP